MRCLLLFCLVGSWACRTDPSLVSRPTGLMEDDPIDKNLIPEAPVLTSKQALKAFDIQPGFTIQLVAVEPIVQAPVVAHFDYDGQLWVLTMPSYMKDTIATDEDQPSGQLLKLVDKDQDGFFEDQEVKIDSLVLPRSFKILKDGILLAEPPGLYYYPMSTGKMKNRMVVDSAYATQGDVEHRPNGLYLNLDNWMYNAKSSQKYKWNASGLWSKAETEFRGQWGISGDDKGRLFYNHNSAALLADDLMPNWLESQPYYTNKSKGVMGVSRTDNKVNSARINPGVNRAYQKGVLDSTGKLSEMTAACGALVYRDQQFPTAYYNNYFVCEPSANLIQRLTIGEDAQGMLKISRPDSTREFLRSTDERFRPVHVFDGPDGCVYVVDMYRGIIQHKNYLTPYLKRQISYRQLQGPLDLGRIYKICHQEKREIHITLSDKSDTALVYLLLHQSSYYRDRAKELLIQRQAHGIKDFLLNQFDLAEDYKILASLLWTLDGLGFMDTQLIAKAINKKNADLNQSILKLIEQYPSAVDLQHWLDDLCINKSLKLAALPIVKKQLITHAGFFQWLGKLENDYPQDVTIKDAIVKAVSGQEKEYLRYSPYLKKELNETINKKKLMQSLQLKMKPSELSAMLRGYDLFHVHCGICHGKTGEGIPGLAPTLVESNWVTGDSRRLIGIVLDGLKGPIHINEKAFGVESTLMPGHRQQPILTDQKLADILTFVRGAFGHVIDPITRQTVNKVREETKDRRQPYEMKDFIK